MKRVIGLVMVMVIVITMIAQIAYADGGYSDVPSSHWAMEYINRATLTGILNGYPDGTFKPEKQVTVGEYLKMLAKMYAPRANIRKAEAGEHWSMPYAEVFIGMLYSEVPFTYEEMNAVIIRGDMARYISSVNSWMRTSENKVKQPDFSYFESLKDKDKIPQNYRVYIDYCMRTGIINGFEDGTFRYDEGLTRAQAAKVMLIALNSLRND